MEQAVVISTPLYSFRGQVSQLGNWRAVSELCLTPKSKLPTLCLPFLQEVPKSNEIMHFFHMCPLEMPVFLAILKRIAFAWISMTYVESNIMTIIKVFKKEVIRGKTCSKSQCLVIAGSFYCGLGAQCIFCIYWFVYGFTNNPELQWHVMLAAPLIPYCGSHIWVFAITSKLCQAHFISD